MNENRQSKRVQISTSAIVRLALEVRARKMGVAPATLAAILVRQGLEQTIQSDAVQSRLREQKASWTTAQRLEDMSDDYELETLYKAASQEEASGGAAPASASAG